MRIRRYIRGHRRGPGANRIEREAMRDPFLAEALEGYEGVNEDPGPQIDRLRHKIRSRNQRRLNVFKYGGFAASLLFIILFGLYFGFLRSAPVEPVVGWQAYERYIIENQVLPTDEANEDNKGEVVLSFRIDSSGAPFDIQIEQSLHPAADKEAMRLVRQGPHWHPTRNRIQYTITFD